MKIKLHHLLTLGGLVALSSCVYPTPVQPQPAMSMAEWEASERAVNRVEDQSFQFRHRERMSNAQAIEMATRNNPTHISNQSTHTSVWVD